MTVPWPLRDTLRGGGRLCDICWWRVEPLTAGDNVIILRPVNVKRFHRSARYARQFIAEHGPLHPMTIGFNDEEGSEICLVTPWADDDEKRRALKLITLAFAVHGVNEYHFMTEACMTTRSEADAHRRPGGGFRVSDIKEKTDVLLLVGASYDDPAGLAMVMEMVRDEAGRLVQFGEPLVNNSSQGMMLELLPSLDFVVPEEYKPLVSRFLDQCLWKPDFVEIEGEH